ncbi:MAG TPA: hypothetical protein VJT78_07295 [Candidatus Dormibacteraeota bacterium]|nr:hypothetical protein [Candidatus Dormibacteraeota bacterium]
MIWARRSRLTPSPSPAAYCELDRWRFDPRYTQGRCPICGWTPAGAPDAPRWMRFSRRVDWELFGLFMLADVLLVLGLVVAGAAGLLPHMR